MKNGDIIEIDKLIPDIDNSDAIGRFYDKIRGRRNPNTIVEDDLDDLDKSIGLKFNYDETYANRGYIIVDIDLFMLAKIKYGI